jgi:hypothetical protein
MNNSNYFNVGLDDPDSAMMVGAKISSFGGPEDVKSGQDNGEFAFGGSSVDDQGQESKLNYAAIDPAWYKNGIKPGSTVDVINPQTGVRVPVVLTEKGPDRWTGRGIDVAPHVLNQLGLDTDETAYIDFKPAIMNPPQAQPMQDSGQEDLTTRQGAQDYLQRMTAPGQPMQASNTPSSGVRSDVTSTSDEALGGVKKLTDGGYDLGDGVVGYPNGVFSTQNGNTITQYIPDANSKSGYKVHTQNVQPKSQIYRDPTSGITYDISGGISKAKPLDLPGDPSSIDMNKVKPGDWDSVPEDLRDVAKNIASYKYPKVTGFALRSPYFQNLFKVVSKVDPSFNYMEYDKRQKLLNDFSGEGKMGQNIVSFNTALRHAQNALDASERLGKVYDSDQVSNWAILHGKSLTGNTALGNYQTDANTFVRELERAVTGSAGTVSGIKEQAAPLLGGLGHLPTAEQRKEAMGEMSKLLGGRLGEVENTYERGFGKKPDIAFLSPEAEKTLRNLGLDDIADKYGTKGGKRPYIDPENMDSSTQPFPGASQPDTEQKIPLFRDATGKIFGKMPDGTLVPQD